MARFTDGRPDESGPAGVWALPLHPLVDDGVDRQAEGAEGERAAQQALEVA